MTKPSRNLWSVRMQHLSYDESLLVLAPDSIKAAKKAITFCRRDGVRRPVVKAVNLDGTIDVF